MKIYKCSVQDHPSASRGFTLLEVLVALLVLSIGLLGLAGMQTLSLKNNNSALMRSQAVVLAYDAVDLMRGNRVGALKGSPEGAASFYRTEFADDGSTVSCGVCSSDDQAKNDISAWKQRIDAMQLPGGEGQIEISDVAGEGVKVRVGVRWDDNRDGDTQDAAEAVFVESLL